jgi:DDE_Tnp_1-associated
MPSKETLEQFGSLWEGLDDPRSGNAALYDFHELLIIALCCVLCGGQGAVDMALFGEAKEPCLRSFLTLANGMPSHDPCSRLFRNLGPDQFRDSFHRFMAQFSSQAQGVVVIDGKVLRRSFDHAGTVQRGSGPVLGRGKQPPLAAGCGDERGSGQNAHGAWAAQSGSATPYGHQRDAKGGIERLPSRQLQTRRLRR